MKTVGIEDLRAWLETLPPELIVGFDALEPRHCVMAEYFKAQRYEDVVIEYDKARSDKKTIATFEPLLSKMLYSLCFVALRYTPTVCALLEYICEQHYQEALPFFELPDEETNALYESALRPKDLGWLYWDRVEYEGETYRVRLSVLSASKTYQPDAEISLPYSIRVVSKIARPELERLCVRHHHHDGQRGHGNTSIPVGRCVFSGVAYDLGTMSGLAAREHVEIYDVSMNQVFAIYKSQDAKLIRAEGVPRHANA